ncbi:MAG: glutathione S-transferase family protein [Pseudomonadota bacterium]
MIVLKNFGPAFGLPDPSPFCMKAEILLKMAGQDYETTFCDPTKMPKGKAPVIVDGGVTIPDTTFIRRHLESTYDVDFDAGLSPAERGVAWAFEKLCEDNLYWIVLSERWTIDANFNAGPIIYFKTISAPLRPVIVALVRRQIKRNLHGQGLGRHTRDELMTIAQTGVEAISAHLGDKPYLMGNEPCGADAVVFGTIGNMFSEIFETRLPELVRAHPNLVAYRDRCMGRWYPDFEA